MSNIFEIGKAYSFSVYPSAIIDNDYTNAVCTGIFTARNAALYIDIAAMHAQVYPYLPSGTPDSPDLYNYVQFQVSDGSSVVLGLPWININTVNVVDTQRIMIEVNNTTSGDINNLRQILIDNGYESIKIHVVNNKQTNLNSSTSNLYTQ